MHTVLAWRQPGVLMAAGSIIALLLVSPAMADVIPFDPHALMATGGDATPISSTLPIIFSNPGGTNQGGGIFVFMNATGHDLAEVDVAVDLPDAFLNGFSLTQTIFVPPGSGQQASTGFSLDVGSNCVGTSTSDTCLHMSFALDPGPLVPLGGNFVLDFDAKPNNQYGFVDNLVATGQYNAENCGDACTGTTDTSNARIGEWPDSTQAFVTPIPAVPEPRYYAAGLAGLLVFLIYFRRRRVRGSSARSVEL